MDEKAISETKKCPRGTWTVLTALAVASAGIACNDSGTNLPTQDDTADVTTTDNVLLNDALSYEGSLAGKVVDTQSTRASTADTSTAQTVPPTFETGEAGVSFRDMAGHELKDGDGEPIPEAPLLPDGTFEAEGLPVGVDFTVCVDLDDDGVCDLEASANIPAAGEGYAGELDGAQVDPLTTLILAKLRAMLEAQGIDPAEMPISPVALAARVIEAYTHLFEETGIDHELTLEDIAALTPEELGELFDAVIPAGARMSMQVVEGNLKLAGAAEVESTALAAAEVFLRAGFPIAEDPEGLDLSPLAELDGVEAMPLSEFFSNGDPLKEDFMAVDEDLSLAPAQLAPDQEQMTVYVNSLAEPDRNFSDEEGDSGEGPTGPGLPILHDHLLIQMAQLQLEGRRISVNDLHAVLTDLQEGMGARLTYFVSDPHFFGPPLTVFETADGKGTAISMEQVFAEFYAEGFDTFDPEEIDRRDAELRALLVELLGDTVAPSVERLAGAFMSERIAGMTDLTNLIREARAHLPFSRTGPSTFFVVADGDPFRNEAAVSPVSVDAEVTSDGEVSSVTYNSAGDGRYYLMFTENTSNDGTVQLLVREAGRPLHGARGPVRLSMHDEAVFASVNGAPA